MTKEVIDKKRERFIISAIVVVIAIIAGLMSIYKFPLKLENMAEDSLYQNAGVVPNDIKIIAIDDKTLENLGAYTEWDRGIYADLFELLNKDAKARLR